MSCPILLLADPEVASHLRNHLLAENPDLTVAQANTADALHQALTSLGPKTRLIAFLTDVIVPAKLLAPLDIEPINIHPGPPELPGAHPEVFAIWESAHQHGVTAHVMTPKVDTGDILHCHRFDIPPGIARRDLGDLTFAAAVDVFRVISDHCAISIAPMPRIDATWQGPHRRKQDLKALLEKAHQFDVTTRTRLDRASGMTARTSAKNDPGISAQ